MSYYLLISFIFIGLFLAFSLGQVFLYFFDKKEKLYLLMAALGFFSSIYLFLSIHLHTTNSLELLSDLLKWQIAAYLVVMGLLTAIINKINENHFNLFFKGVMGFILVLIVVNFLEPNGIIFNTIEGLGTKEVFAGDNYNTFQGTLNQYYIPLALATYAVFISFFVINARYAKRGKHQLRNRIFLWIMAVYLISNLYDVLLDFGLMSGVFLTEYMVLPIIMLLNMNVFIEIRKGREFQERYDEAYKNFMILIQHVELYVVALDAKREIRYANPYFMDRMGLEKLGAEQRDFKNLFMAREEALDFDAIFKSIWRRGDVSHVDFSLINEKKEVYFVDWSIVPVKSTEGKVVELLAVGTDISSQVQTARELKMAVDQLSDAKEQLENENTLLRRNRATNGVRGHMIGNSDTMKYVYHSIEEVAQSDSTVLIEGETGVGKELVAKAIHDKSRRAEKPYIKVNCGALPKDLIESELFGHEKGAFTGAINSRKGRFELADGGTLFLDEIGELPLDLQAKLLRVLENSEFSRLGSEELRQVDVRIVAATNKNLKQCTQKGSFRMDLYFRLSVFPITVPPLRKRVDDIPLLVDHFLSLFCDKLGLEDLSVSLATMKKLEAYSWPGNVRELKNVIERGVISSTHRKKLYIDPSSLSEFDGTVQVDRKSLMEMERDYIIAVLNDVNWKISGKNSASQILDLKEGTLRSKMKKLGIERDDV